MPPPAHGYDWIFLDAFEPPPLFPRTTLGTRQDHKMPPKRATKKREKRTARPATQTADGPVNSHGVSGSNADATTEITYMEDDISPELAELMDSAPW